MAVECLAPAIHTGQVGTHRNGLGKIGM
jgi:hypothetical protein